MVQAKYIIIEDDVCEAVIVFSQSLLHQDVARHCKVLSAGFCKLDAKGRWSVSGNSFSLHLGAKEKDVNLLNALLPMGGCVFRPTTLAD